jgi:hypothetical protein
MTLIHKRVACFTVLASPIVGLCVYGFVTDPWETLIRSSVLIGAAVWLGAVGVLVDTFDR